MTTKTDQAFEALVKAHPVTNRGHAFIIIDEAGLSGSGRVFNAAVKRYEERFELALGKSRAARRAEREETLRAIAHQSSADDVRDHINKIDKADGLFWAFWNAFRYENKWSNTLESSDFAVHFDN